MSPTAVYMPVHAHEQAVHDKGALQHINGEMGLCITGHSMCVSICVCAWVHLCHASAWPLVLARNAAQGVALLAVWGEPAKQARWVTHTLPTHCRAHTVKGVPVGHAV